MSKAQEEPDVRGHKVGGIDFIPIDDPRLASNENIPTLFADMVNFVGRSDNLAQLGFYAKVPGKNIEVARILITNQTLVNLHAIFDGYIQSLPEESRPKAKTRAIAIKAAHKGA